MSTPTRASSPRNPTRTGTRQHVSYETRVAHQDSANAARSPSRRLRVAAAGDIHIHIHLSCVTTFRVIAGQRRDASVLRDQRVHTTFGQPSPRLEDMSRRRHRWATLRRGDNTSVCSSGRSESRDRHSRAANRANSRVSKFAQRGTELRSLLRPRSGACNAGRSIRRRSPLRTLDGLVVLRRAEVRLGTTVRSLIESC